jgi:hypothetical protein
MQIPTQKWTTLTDVFMVFLSPFRQMTGLCRKLDSDCFRPILNPMGQSLSHSAIQDVPYLLQNLKICCNGHKNTTLVLILSYLPYPELPSLS